ncbi:MAG: hypothetical protein IJG70_06960 [Kiritimatiellae bacterium]|nr:hypothetical protein [Kiritimatiellia bacterium]
MNRKTTTKTIIALLAAAVAIAVALLLLLGPGGVMSPGDDASDDEDVEIVEEDSPEGDAAEGEDSESGDVDGGEQDGGDAADGDADEDEDPDEKLVNAFDALVDSWMEPRDEGVSLADSDAFVAAFRKLPEERREECLQRALNLVPDDNVMLLVGILMDKSIDQELVELVFNDVLNRDEEVKKPILLEIFKDKSHPCWADTAWILDVTEGTPEEE